MKKIKRLLGWIFTNGLMCYGLYLFGVEHNEYAGNIIKFMLIVGFILSIVSAINEPLRSELKKKGFPIPLGVNLTYSILYSCALASVGLFFYASIDLVSTILQNYIYAPVKEVSKNGN